MRYLVLAGAHRTVKFKVTYLTYKLVSTNLKRILKKSILIKILTFKHEFTLMNNQIHSHQYDSHLETGSGYPLSHHYNRSRL